MEFEAQHRVLCASSYFYAHLHISTPIFNFLRASSIFYAHHWHDQDFPSDTRPWDDLASRLAPGHALVTPLFGLTVATPVAGPLQSCLSYRLPLPLALLHLWQYLGRQLYFVKTQGSIFPFGPRRNCQNHTINILAGMSQRALVNHYFGSENCAFLQWAQTVTVRSQDLHYKLKVHATTCIGLAIHHTGITAPGSHVTSNHKCCFLTAGHWPIMCTVS